MEKKAYIEPAIKVRFVAQTLLAGSLEAKEEKGTGGQLSKDTDGSIQWDDFMGQE
ncbi:MAG: hypothetical protein IKH22_05755 [Prevotella sp.]|nr:hypothetical protein [Prevotella sp.]